MNFVEKSLQNKQITVIVTFILLVLGVFSLFNMPRREDPKMTIRQGLVIMLYPGATTLQMEEQVTKKVENLLFRYEEVKKKKTESTTTDGQMIIQVELQDWVKNKDKLWSKIRHDLYELKHKSLPKGVIGPIINSDFGDTVALLISVSSARHSYAEMEDYIEIIEDELRPLPQVSKLKRYGQQREQIYVTMDSQKMSQYGLSEGQVMHVLQSMNTISYAGELESETSVIPIHFTDYYNSLEQIKKQIVAVSNGQGIIRLGDIAKIQRRFQEPNSFIRVNGKPVVMLSVEMQQGFNIVEFGEKVEQRLKIAEQRIPKDVDIKKIINQPLVVKTDIQHFMKEFLIAVVAVILVTMILLPLRVAVVAALAIPITILITFAGLDFLDINLQQMTLAGLIVVLGMVVDNAIVVVDDYVDRLDHDSTPYEAAVKSASELFIPVFSATLAIIFAFIPLNFILTGNSGEFLFTLPVSVGLALLVSLLVAMFMVPLLCFVCIKTGIHQNKSSLKSFTFLDLAQKLYNRILAGAFKLPFLPILLGILAIVGTFFLAQATQIRMFPVVERNQFCLEVYMDKGTKLEATDKAVIKLEKLLKSKDCVKDTASFVGMSSPRFYTTYAPQFPGENYAQLLITTKTAEQAGSLAHELVSGLQNFIPHGNVLVKTLRNGPPAAAPIEIRVVGNDLKAIKNIGAKIKHILKNTPGANFVRTTFQEDYYGISLDIDEELANRLGFSRQDIALSMAQGFKGAPVSTLWEGDHPLDIILRLDKAQRDQLTDIQNIYLVSPITKAKVPLRQIATVKPKWHTGRLRRRNGVRTLTVQSEAQLGLLPNEVISKIKPQIKAIDLPKGITILWGGEKEDESQVLREQTTSLVISLVLIYLVLLCQFKKSKKAILIMLAIPMSWFGAFLGLVVTNNDFSFTAFLGIISLSGLVVRNGIILVEYADKLQKAKPDWNIRKVAIEAGKRRMRPVFLTAMAAAMGVVPMIIGGSSLWAPLGSVLSVGLVFGMILTLLIMPILYYLMLKPRKFFRKKAAPKMPEPKPQTQTPKTLNTASSL